MKKHLSLLLGLVLCLTLAVSAALAAEGDITIAQVAFASGNESDAEDIYESNYTLVGGKLPEKPASFVPVSPEWQFVGWEYYDSFYDEYVIGQPGEPVLNPDPNWMHFLAIWDDGKCAVDFGTSDVSHGGSFSMRVKAGETLTLPDVPDDWEPYYEGAVFAGWGLFEEYLDDQLVFLPGDQVVIREDLWFEAVWQHDWLTVHCPPNGCDGSPLFFELKKGSQFTVPEKPEDFIPYDPSYTFAGWEYYDVLNGRDVTIQPGEKMTVNFSVDLIPIWSNGMSDVCLYNDIGPSDFFTVPNGAYTVPQNPFDPPAAGMTFTGWYYFDQDGNQVDVKPGDQLILKDESLSLYADWDSGSQAVVMVCSSYDGELDQLFLVSSDVPYRLPANPFPGPEDAVFGGWEVYDDALEQYVVYAPGDMLTLQEAYTYIYALWQYDECDLWFYPRAADSFHVSLPANSVYTMPEPSSPGSPYVKFLGWIDTYNGKLLKPGERLTVNTSYNFEEEWVPITVWVNNRLLSDGQYMDVSGRISAAKPAGGYVYLKNGVLTLSNFQGRSITSGDAALTLQLQGSNTLESDGDVITIRQSDLTIQGDGTLNLRTEMDNDGIDMLNGNLYIKGGDIRIQVLDQGIELDEEYGDGRGKLLMTGGKLTIAAKFSDAIDAEEGVEITGGELDITTEGDDAIYSGDGEIVISGGSLKLRAKDDGLDADEKSIRILGGSITIHAGDDGVEGDYLQTGGQVSIYSDDNGIYGDTVTLIGGKLSIASRGGWAIKTNDAINASDLRILRLTDEHGYDRLAVVDADGKPVAQLIWEIATTSATAAPPRTGDSTNLTLLLMLAASSAAVFALVFKKRHA